MCQNTPSFPRSSAGAEHGVARLESRDVLSDRFYLAGDVMPDAKLPGTAEAGERTEGNRRIEHLVHRIHRRGAHAQQYFVVPAARLVDVLQGEDTVPPTDNRFHAPSGLYGNPIRGQTGHCFRPL